MKTFGLVLAFTLWMIFTLVLCFSIIGLILLAPSINDSTYYIPVYPTRTSTWMRIGLDIKDKLLENA
jgi:hypothetical protein